MYDYTILIDFKTFLQLVKQDFSVNNPSVCYDFDFFAWFPFAPTNCLYKSLNLSYSSFDMMFLLLAFTNSSLNLCIPILLGATGFEWFF